MKETKYTCGDCAFLNTEDESYYCLMKDLYHFCTERDEICGDFEYKEIVKTEKAFKI